MTSSPVRKSPPFGVIRASIASLPADVSHDAVGSQAPRVEEMYAPETHAAALDPNIPIVVGSRGAGKSFWSGVLGQDSTRKAADAAFPRLGLARVKAAFGYTGFAGAEAISPAVLHQMLGDDPTLSDATAVWWAAILRACQRHTKKGSPLDVNSSLQIALDPIEREARLEQYEADLGDTGAVLLVVFDALDTIATSWPRRRLLTEALLQVVWSLRAYRNIKSKLFLRPDQIDDEALRFVELPKLRTGAVRLTWSGADLYGMLYGRLALTPDREYRSAFSVLLDSLDLPIPANQAEVLSREWRLSSDVGSQMRLMDALAGPFMADGPYGFKKGKTYSWPLSHLADAFEEVTPRSFLGLIVAAAKYGPIPQDRALSADGIRHGLRAASKTRVDQLHQEFPWIKGVLAPLAGLLLPQPTTEVFKAWRAAKTVSRVREDAAAHNYLPPFTAKGTEEELLDAMKRIGVMYSRRDERIDMPDLYRVAANLLKKGGTAPLA